VNDPAIHVNGQYCLYTQLLRVHMNGLSHSRPQRHGGSWALRGKISFQHFKSPLTRLKIPSPQTRRSRAPAEQSKTDQLVKSGCFRPVNSTLLVFRTCWIVLLKK
jgi:hypothetical protein